MPEATPRPLPRIMVTPNGARRGKADHPALPVTDDELIETWAACAAAGADGLHAHIRDDAGAHLLDAGRYRALLARLDPVAPGAYLQVTSEAAGRYAAPEQQAMVRALRPAHVSVALREMLRQPEDGPAARDFYHWAAGAGVAIQHILYSPDETRAFLDAVAAGQIPGTQHQIQLVIGSYAGDPPSLADLDRHADLMARAPGLGFDWMLCAFGPEETACLAHAATLGGKARVGFENSLHMADGRIAKDNAERVAEVVAAVAVAQGA
ncbi:MAG: class III aminotransferase [Alteromonadaceae bacterium]|nr:class III aminotransferase [Alteromonadaceae bacterium]